MSANLLVILTGSIAAYKACDAISQLVQRGHRVRVAATEAALRFIGPATLEGLTGRPPLSGMFEAGAALEHINLTRWADAVLVCPATANTINRLAAGLADDLPGALFLAHDRAKPWLVAPAMNPQMWSHPATVAAVARLESWGVRFLPVGEGRTACGETGEGRLGEPADIVSAVEAVLAVPTPRLRLLVTSGGTAEPIDGVRVLTNTSTGRTGAGLAAHFARRGHDVFLLRARQSAPAPAGVRSAEFTTFADLDTALAGLFAAEDFDAVVHAAAVGDFGVAEILTAAGAHPPGAGKLDSDDAPMIRLRTHAKIVDSLRARSRNPRLRIVAFKLTDHAGAAETDAAVGALFARAGADFVVHNDLAQRGSGDDFPATIRRPGEAPVACASRAALAAELERLLLDPLRAAPAELNPDSRCSSVST